MFPAKHVTIHQDFVREHWIWSEDRCSRPRFPTRKLYLTALFPAPLMWIGCNSYWLGKCQESVWSAAGSQETLVILCCTIQISKGMIQEGNAISFLSSQRIIHFKIKIKSFVMEVFTQKVERILWMFMMHAIRVPSKHVGSLQSDPGSLAWSPTLPASAGSGAAGPVGGVCWGLTWWVTVSEDPAERGLWTRREGNIHWRLKRCMCSFRVFLLVLYFSSLERVFSIFNDFIFQEAVSWNLSCWARISGSGRNWKICPILWPLQ